MGDNNKNLKNGTTVTKSKNKVIVIAGILIIIIAAIFIVKGNFGGGADLAIQKGESTTASSGAVDLVIPKGEISETVKFFPLKAGSTNMEVLAVKAPDGTIRTAFNTCQVCNGSPKAYYKQQGNVLVCQNCGNKFSMDMLEKQRGGCNPVPIMKENKTDDANNIVISKDFIEKNKDLFTANWKTK